MGTAWFCFPFFLRHAPNVGNTAPGSQPQKGNFFVWDFGTMRLVSFNSFQFFESSQPPCLPVPTTWPDTRADLEAPPASRFFFQPCICCSTGFGRYEIVAQNNNNEKKNPTHVTRLKATATSQETVCTSVGDRNLQAVLRVTRVYYRP